MRGTLVELDGEPLADDGHTPFPELDTEASTFSGPAAATASREASRPAVPASASGPLRRRSGACEEEIMRREAAFVATLEAADGIGLDGYGLALRADGLVLARLFAGA